MTTCTSVRAQPCLSSVHGSRSATAAETDSAMSKAASSAELYAGSDPTRCLTARGTTWKDRP